MREHPLDPGEVDRLPGDEAVADRLIVLARDRHALDVEREGVERGADRPLDRVLERHQRQVGSRVGNG